MVLKGSQIALHIQRINQEATNLPFTLVHSHPRTAKDAITQVIKTLLEWWWKTIPKLRPRSYASNFNATSLHSRMPLIVLMVAQEAWSKAALFTRQPDMIFLPYIWWKESCTTWCGKCHFKRGSQDFKWAEFQLFLPFLTKARLEACKVPPPQTLVESFFCRDTPCWKLLCWFAGHSDIVPKAGFFLDNWHPAKIQEGFFLTNRFQTRSHASFVYLDWGAPREMEVQ